MRARVRGVLTGLSVIGALAAIIGGLPVLLYRLGGSPWPQHLASLHRITAILASRDDSGILLAAIRDCTWLAWLLFSLSVIAETCAAMRGGRRPQIRLGGFQGVAARLVALAALTFTAPPLTSTASAAVISTQQGQAFAAPGLATARETSPANSAGGDLLAEYAMTAASATKLITVRSGDCLWSIAQQYLGSGDRYPEIASLNYGHDMGHGHVFTNPSLIEPGWRLRLPGAADAGGARANHSGQSGTEGRPGDYAAVGPRAPYRHLGHASADRHYQRRHLAAGGPTQAEQTGYQRPANGVQPSGNSVIGADQLPAVGVFVVGALAGSILTRLNELRRRQRQTRRAGRRIALPVDLEVLATEQQLRAAAPDEAPVTLRSALARLERSITAAGHMLPDIVGLHVTLDLLEILLAAPAAEPPPAPFSITPGRQGMSWQLDTSHLGEERPGSCHLLPGLFTAGATVGGCLLLDLEALQVTGCDGPPDLVDRVITTIATELAAGQWAGWYELILVGCDNLEAAGKAVHASDLDEAVSLIEARHDAARRRLVDRPQSDVRQLRLIAPDDEDWGLTILVSRIEPSPGQLERLIDLADDGAGGVAVLVAGDIETSTGRMAPAVLQLAPDPQEPGEIIANVVPLQITVRPRVLSAADYDAIGTLFTVAADCGDVSKDDSPYAMCAAPLWIPQAASRSDDFVAWEDTSDQPPWEEKSSDTRTADRPGTSGLGRERTGPRHAAASRLEVKVLGPFEVSGAAEQLQPKHAELMLALALSGPSGLSNSALGSLLGSDPDHPKPNDTVRQIIGRARRRLGLASDGREYIRHAGNGTYVLHPDVSLDWNEFQSLAASGDADALRAAIALIRGEPFTGGYFWWIDIPLLETVRAELVDAAAALAELELAAGSPRAAARAARAGLRAEVSAEQLWRVLMRAEYAAGNLAGVSEAWRWCLDAIEDVSPGGEPHPDTEALYYQLTHPARHHAEAKG